MHYFVINTWVSFLNKYSELIGAEDGKSEWFSVTSYRTVECTEHRRSELEQKKRCWNTDNTPAFYLFVCDVSQQADRLSNASVPVSAAQPHTDRESQTAATALPSPSQEAEILFLKYYSALYSSSFLKDGSTRNPQWRTFDNHSSFYKIKTIIGVRKSTLFHRKVSSQLLVLSGARTGCIISVFTVILCLIWYGNKKNGMVQLANWM